MPSITAWYLKEGDYENAALSAAACIPLLGSVVGNGLKWGAKGVANAEKVADTVKLGSRIVGDGGALLLSGGQAVESAKQVYTNITNGEGLTWKNAVDVITLGISVAGMGMAGASIAKSGKSLKAMYKGETAVSNVATSNATKGVSQARENAGAMRMDLQMFGGKSASNNYYADTYDGVRKASEYLKQQGVPRQYRKQILESFDVRTIKVKTAGENTYGLRFYGGNANAEGRYLFETFSPLTNRENLALPYEWNSMTGIQQFQVKNGTTMLTGAAAPQSSFGEQYVGGAHQWYINSLEDMIKCH